LQLAFESVMLLPLSLSLRLAASVTTLYLFRLTRSCDVSWPKLLRAAVAGATTGSSSATKAPSNRSSGTWPQKTP